ncbi:hypothetical protein GALMADRAFT_155530 [Galerina marginata CBS 339.88]|uniref:Uncharacterized protein n=1 Tax=Galerina marginata (strain CBS 339.88) TaxID=685588 RepID=A0A067T3I0_GALM3|nr:hypothetical protein GALMADRAFT_155530 [Galerina marginata CBS 339.88]
MTSLYMSPLRRILQHLKYTKEWNLLIEPDPREFNGYKRRGPEPIYPEYYICLESERPFLHGPTLAHASNLSAWAGGIEKCKSPASPNRSDWIRVVDTGEARTLPGRKVGDVLVEILQEFPRFDMRSEKGIEQAINHIMDGICSVAMTQELDDDLLNGPYKGEDEDDSED